MTPETLIIILVITGCITAVLVVNTIFQPHSRDYAARDRDRGLAKLFTARAEIVHVESLERRRVLDDQAALRREQVCDDVRDARGSA